MADESRADVPRGPIEVDAEAVLKSPIPQLAAAKPWFEIRSPRRPTIVLDDDTLAALAAVMNVKISDSRQIFEQFSVNRQA